MIYQNTDIHGAVELEQVPGGVIPYRFPKSVYEPLDLKGHALTPVGMELRFVPEGEVKITLSALHPGSSHYLSVFYGSLQSGKENQHLTIPSTSTTFTFHPSKML